MSFMVSMAQQVSASGCDPEGRRFEPGWTPHIGCYPPPTPKTTTDFRWRFWVKHRAAGRRGASFAAGPPQGKRRPPWGAAHHAQRGSVGA